eukprot:15441270-Alexandrium_andersonii.AAC.1
MSRHPLGDTVASGPEGRGAAIRTALPAPGSALRRGRAGGAPIPSREESRSARVTSWGRSALGL